MGYAPYGLNSGWGAGGWGDGPWGGSNAPTYLQFRQALAARLADPGNVFWTDAECGLYIAEALRTWNALTATWTVDFAFTGQNVLGSIWFGFPLLTGSPRVRTVTDSQIYTIMQYHLLEPPTGSTWSGTSQFNIADLSGALQRRRDEILQFTTCNIVEVIQAASGARRTVLADDTLEVLRAQYVPYSTQGPVTLFRDDGLSLEYFQTGYLQQSGSPQSYDTSSTPPLALDINLAPNVPGNFALLCLVAGVPFNPPTSSLLGIPDDFSWLAKWGAMSDLLGRESEATDIPRAQYCLNRYQDGLKLMMTAPWLTLGQINGIPVDTVSVAEMDAYSAEWDSNPAAPQAIVTAGVDILAVSPVPQLSGTVGVQLRVVGNAPIPANDAAPVQAGPDVLDVILDYAQHLACFKMGGADFLQSKDLAKNFALSAMAYNSRLKELGIFRDLLLGEGQRQMEQQERFSEAK